jgi:hypothetical protein
MLAFVVAVPEALKPANVGQALSGIFGSVSLTAWICLLVGATEGCEIDRPAADASCSFLN